MLIDCDNRGCMQQTDAKLDLATQEVICGHCNKPINNVTKHMKRVMQFSGQVIRRPEAQKFMVPCMNCQANRLVEVNQEGQIVCGFCKVEVSAPDHVKKSLLANFDPNAVRDVKIKSGANKKKITKKKIAKNKTEDVEDLVEGGNES